MTHAVESSPIPSHLVSTPKRSGNLKFLLAGGILLTLIVVLITYSTLSTGAYYLTVSEAVQQPTSLVGQRVRVSGTVVDGSEVWDPQSITLRFAIHDDEGAELPVLFYGPRPDNFQRAAQAIVEGELQDDGSFRADTLLLKCPSRYEEQPEEIFVESSR